MSDRANPPARRLFKGIAAAPGVVVGAALVLDRHERRVVRRRILEHEVDHELERFAAAVAKVSAGVRALGLRVAEAGPEASLLEAYALMAEDDLLRREVERHIVHERRSASFALVLAVRSIARGLGDARDPYLRERSHDVGFIGEELRRALTLSEAEVPLALESPTIVVGYELSPADALRLGSSNVLAFVTEVGSRTSHTAILARALAVPCVVGLVDALEAIESGSVLCVDGARGTVVVHPTADDRADAARRVARQEALRARLDEGRERPTRTSCGVRVRLLANLELPSQVEVAKGHGAEGVGLFRTEFLYLDRTTSPSEEEQHQAFVRVAQALPSRPVTLRTFDLGGDKLASAVATPREANPLLGTRAVRLQLREPDLLLTQLRAVARASFDANLRVMVPLVSSVDELAQVRVLFERARAEITLEAGRPVPHVPLGAMIEVPAAALLAREFAREAEFLSIGTNDLAQYTLAVDRSSRALAHLASPYHPAVLRLLAMVIDAGRALDRPVSLCGEIASEPHDFINTMSG